MDLKNGTWESLDPDCGQPNVVSRMEVSRMGIVEMEHGKVRPGEQSGGLGRSGSAMPRDGSGPNLLLVLILLLTWGKEF